MQMVSPAYINGYLWDDRRCYSIVIPDLFVSIIFAIFQELAAFGTDNKRIDRIFQTVIGHHPWINLISLTTYRNFMSFQPFTIIGLPITLTGLPVAYTVAYFIISTRSRLAKEPVLFHISQPQDSS